MIVSASYKTDIPAFYGQWFMARLDAGFCRTVNPYGGQASEVPLGPEHVDGFVFWTRNAGPFLDALHEVRRRGYPFVIQFTVTGYPRALERSVIEAERAVDQIRQIARAFGKHAVVWRYDPIVASELTPFEWHPKNFTALAAALDGAVDEVVISFAQIYRKTKRNLDSAARVSCFHWSDPSDEAKRKLSSRLAGIAQGYGMRLTICAQPGYRVEGAQDARCIDVSRLSSIAGYALASRPKGNRPGCLCDESRDIGVYDTCPHGCVYCYAVNSRAAALRNHGAHETGGEFMIESASKRAVPPQQGFCVNRGGEAREG